MPKFVGAKVRFRTFCCTTCHLMTVYSGDSVGGRNF